VTTRRELAAALERAVHRRGKFSLVDVMLPRGATSDTLARFVAGFKPPEFFAAIRRAGCRFQWERDTSWRASRQTVTA
jgi:hypothetical protein